MLVRGMRGDGPGFRKFIDARRFCFLPAFSHPVDMNWTTAELGVPNLLAFVEIGVE